MEKIELYENASEGARRWARSHTYTRCSGLGRVCYCCHKRECNYRELAIAYQAGMDSKAAILGAIARM